ncbi:MAG: Rieske (2Fe-2S) protein [Proteobacteria bacterium]|nr:Rieske (2Fe-2S) protein [Pseudomonadota bacterium]
MESKTDERRTFIKKTIAALFTIGSGSLLYSVIHYFSPKQIHIQSKRGYAGIFDAETNRAKRKNNAFLPVKTSDGHFEIDLSKLPDGESAFMSLSDIPVIAVNRGDNYRIFNATCTHLGCLVKWDPSGKRFICPCHGGIYNEDGEVVAGPPPAAIKEYKTEVSGTFVKIMVA